MIVGCTITCAVGILCIILGISNIRGNLSSIHSYHRHRVLEQDVLPFGRLVGSGTVLAGVATIILGIFMLLADLLSISTLLFVGCALFFTIFSVGMALCFYAMIKYNKGIF